MTDTDRIIQLSGIPYENSPAECFMEKFNAISKSHPLDPKARILDDCAVLLFPSFGNKSIHISSMDSMIKGSGTKALKAICNIADECKVPLNLVAYGYADTPTDKLVEWYSRFGFNTTGIGSKKDGYRMTRTPVLKLGGENRIIKLKGFDRPH